MVKDADTSCFSKAAFLQNSIGPRFNKIRDAAGVPTREGPCKGKFNMRSMRCYQGTKWVKLCAEYKAMGWKMPPLNPLQHTTPKLTKGTYAEANADDENQAR